MSKRSKESKPIVTRNRRSEEERLAELEPGSKQTVPRSTRGSRILNGS